MDLNLLVRSNLFRDNIIIAVVITILKKPHRYRGRCYAGSCGNNEIHKPPSPCALPGCASAGCEAALAGKGAFLLVRILAVTG